jgi:hypothetical protein
MFVTGGTAPGRVKFKGELGSCRDASGENGPVPFGIIGAKIKGSFTTSTNACTANNPVTAGPGTATIKWSSAQKLAKSAFTSQDSAYQFDSDGNYFSLPADFVNGTGDVTGSFAGDAAEVFGYSTFAGGNIEITCAPKSSGVKGSGGLRQLDISRGTLAVLFTA